MGISAEEYDNWYYTDRGRYISGLEKRVLSELLTWGTHPVDGSLQHKTCLDIGCGTGYFTEFLGSHCRSIVGVDASIDMIKYVIQKSGAKIKYIVADAENLPFKDESFDMSVSVTAVNFFRNPTKSISEAVRISRKKIFLGVLNKWSILFAFKKLKGFFSKTTYSDACFYSQREMTNMLSAFPQIKRIYIQYTYFLPFPKIRLVLSGIEKLIPSLFPFGGFMGIAGAIERRIG